jgi:PAS domain S-box-containing protein
MWYHVDRERRSVRAYWQAELKAVARDRARLVGDWLQARRADAEVLAASDPVRGVLWIKSPESPGLMRQLARVVAGYGYDSIVVSDTGGRTVARSSAVSVPDEENREIALAVTATATSHLTVQEDPSGRRLLTVAAPVFTEPGTGPRAVLGVVTLRMDGATGLFRLLTDESPPRTDETLLFRLDAGGAVYLSPLRHPPAGWAAVSRSLQALGGLARQASADESVFGEMDDYRAVPVFAAVTSIPLTGWKLGLKVDREEALAEFHRAGQLAGAGAGLLLLAFAGLLTAIWRQRERAVLLRAQVEQERAISSLRSYAEKIVAGVPSGLLLLSSDLSVLSVNPAFLESFGLREADVVGRPLGDVARAEGLASRAREVLETGVVQRELLFDLSLPAAQQTRRVFITMSAIRTAEDEPARLLLIVQDLTEAERLHAARRASDERFRDLVESLDAIVWEADAATLRFSFVSRRAETVLGHPIARWLADPDFFRERIHPDDRARALEVCRDAIARGADHELEYRARAADGREIRLRDIVRVVPAGPHRPALLRGVTVDLTEQRRAADALRQAEDQLRQAQKMDAVGKLAGGIAHDFNNLLMVIRGEADLILRRLEPGDPKRQNAEGIREAADQAATLTRQLLAFSRKQVLAPAVIDLNAVVTGIRKILPRLIGETIELITATAPAPCPVTADAGQLEQMILNLAVNARDAMPNGGRLLIRTSAALIDEDAAPGRGVGPGRFVMLEVSDTGVGMDRETREHLFEPFFTTKEQGKGTGLGLSTVYGIVRQSGGHIAVESEPGHGTTFRIWLPEAPVTGETAVSAPPRPEELVEGLPATPVPAAEGGGDRRETILLVEDARRVREVVREILETSGYDVLEARQGSEALKISDQHHGPIHLMVTDVVMPRMSGRELAQRLLPLRPDMRVLYMSGYTDDAIVRHGVLDAGIAFIPKPFTPDALAAKVRQVLDAPLRGGGAVSRDPGPPDLEPAQGSPGGGRRPSHT